MLKKITITVDVEYDDAQITPQDVARDVGKALVRGASDLNLTQLLGWDAPQPMDFLYGVEAASNGFVQPVGYFAADKAGELPLTHSIGDFLDVGDPVHSDDADDDLAGEVRELVKRPTVDELQRAVV